MMPALAGETQLRRVQVYDGEGECVLDVAVLGMEDAQALAHYLAEQTGLDVYNDGLPFGDGRRALAVAS